MYHYIGIAAYRRCKVRVVIERQTIVTRPLGSVNRLRHRTDGQLCKHILLFFAFHILHQKIERFSYFLIRLGIDAIAEPRCKLRETGQAIRFG